MDESEDPVMARVRAWLEASGLTQHELGIRMGYDVETARKSVWQFLKSKDPRIGMLRRFAKAAGVSFVELVAEPKTSNIKKRGSP